MARKPLADYTKQLQKRSLRNAHRHGQTWDSSEVSLVVNGIDKDETTFDMAMRLGRSYYSVMATRSKVRFAMDHADVLYNPKRKGK